MDKAAIIASLGRGSYTILDSDFRARTVIAEVRGPGSPRLLLTPLSFGGPRREDIADLVALTGPGIAEWLFVGPLPAPAQGNHGPWSAVAAEREPPGVAIDEAMATQPLGVAGAIAVARGLADILVDLHARGQTLGATFLDPEVVYVERAGSGWRFGGIAPRGLQCRARTKVPERAMYNPPPPPPIHLISPEAMKGVPHATLASEVFTLGACLHWWATGESLYGADASPFAALAGGPRQISPALPPPLADLLRRATADDPGQRPTMAALRGGLPS